MAELLIQYADQTVNGKRAVVRNGHLPERSIQTGLGEVPVKVPKVRDRSGGGIKFNSKLVPPYLKRTKNVEEFIPWLYLKGISTGEMQPALGALLGEGAKGLSAATVSRLKKRWEADYRQWSQRDLSRRRYVYVWADGVYSNVRQASLRSRERFWDIRVPKIDSIFDNSLVPRTSWSPGVPPQHRKLVAATHRSPI